MYMNRRRYTPDCNRCNSTCTGKGDAEIICWLDDLHTIPKEGFMLAELTLVHPTSLNKALSALPFKANLNFYLR